MSEKSTNAKLQDFLIGKRKEANLSQQQVANKSDAFGKKQILDQKAVSRLEKNPAYADAFKIAGYLNAIGAKPNEYFDFLKKINNTKEIEMEPNANIEYVQTLVDNKLKNLTEVSSELKQRECHYFKNEIETLIKKAQEALTHIVRKPTIGLFGSFDSGKSTLINTILGMDIIPASYTPATNVINLILHTSDRPTNITDQAIIFKKGFSPYMLHDENSVKEYMIASGNYDILQKHGTHNYEEEIESDAYLAIVFSDSDVLKNIWLMDTPGDMNTEDQSKGNTDTDKAISAAGLVDGIVYLSRFAGFFGNSDLGLASNILRAHPPIDTNNPTSHFMFVMSHCDNSHSKEEIERVKSVTFKRLQNQFNEFIFSPWESSTKRNISPQKIQLVDRTFPFWVENEEFSKQVINEILKIGNFLAETQKEKATKQANNILKALKGKITGFIAILENRKKGKDKRFKELNDQIKLFRSESEKLLKEFKNAIEDCNTFKQKDKDKILKFYSELSDFNYIKNIIEEHYDNKKDAQNQIGDLIGQILTVEIEKTLKKSGESISERVKDLLSKWNNIAPAVVEENTTGEFHCGISSCSTFDARAAFLGGLAGLGSLGAMTFFASSIITSNLGAYILVGQFAGILTSLGLVGSVTSVTSFVSAIGGPITIGIFLAALIGLSIFGISSSWQTSLAKKVAKELNKGKPKPKILNYIEKFWDNTHKAISMGLNNLQHETERHIKTMNQDIKSEYTPDELNKAISDMNQILNGIK
ncbi:dynamin family protein [Desulfobaculum bizertense]|uniref:dynamin family protein n=1 Tax=Desulfobaculum bizertense TaxID=376490 RepID=UPI001F4265E9|nr:dynamin family protein [Desulfobaculum bizertense]UIJ38696.1 dynamin family protein [Desulfobaculum bizertense]